MAVSDDSVTGTEVVLTDRKPVGKLIQSVCSMYKLKKSQIIRLKLYGDGENIYISTNNVKLLHRDLPEGDL